MPLTPEEAIARNKGQDHLQLQRAIQDLINDAEAATGDYTGEPVYVGLSAYLQYRVEAEHVKDLGPATLRLVDRELHKHFDSFGWKIAIVTSPSGSWTWAKFMDARHH